MRERRFDSERAVSELLGYILIFGMVTLAATSLLVLGTAQLESTREAEQMNNAEKAFEVLAGNLEDHITQDVNTRSTEVRIADADLYLDEGEYVYITVSSDDGDELLDRPRGYNPIAYESTQGSKVVYSFGAVFREETDYSRMIQEPGMRIDAEKSVLPVPATVGDDTVTTLDTRVVQVRTEQRTPEQIFANQDDYTVNITIETTNNRAIEWKKYFDESYTDEEDICELNGEDELVCVFSTQEVYVQFYPVSVELN